MQRWLLTLLLLIPPTPVRAERDSIALASIRDRMEQDQDYVRSYSQAEQKYQELLAEGHPMAADFHALMAYIAVFNQDTEKAEKILSEKIVDETCTVYCRIFYAVAEGRISQVRGNLDKAEAYYEQGYQYTQQSQDKKLQVRLLISLAYVNSQQGRSAKVFEYLRILQSFEDKVSTSTKSVIFAETAGLYYDNGDFQKAVVYGEKALKLTNSETPQVDLAAMHGNLGVFYSEQGDLKSALMHRIEAMKIDERINPANIPVRKLMIGETLRELGDLSSALRYVEGLPSVFDRQKYPRYQIESRRSLAEIYLQQGRLDRSLALTTEAKGILHTQEKSPKNDQLLLMLLGIETEILAKAADWKHAYERISEKHRLYLGIVEDERKRGQDEFRVKYDTAVKEKENERLALDKKITDLALDKEKQSTEFYRALVISLSIFVLILALLTIAIIRILRSLSKAKLLTEKQTAEISAIFSMIKQGIFTVEGVNLEINEQMSDFTRENLQIEPRSKLVDFLRSNFAMDEEDISITISILSNSIDMNDLGFTVNADKLPSELIQSKGPLQKIYELDWVPMIQESTGLIKRFLVCFRDVTELRTLRNEMQLKEGSLALASVLITCGKRNFQSLLSLWTKQRQDLLRAMEQRKDGLLTPDLVWVQFKRAIHTIKGTARGYQLHALSHACHDIEQELAGMGESASEDFIKQSIDRVHAMLDELKEIARHRLEWAVDEAMLTIPRQRLQALLAGAALPHKNQARPEQQLEKTRVELLHLIYPTARGTFEAAASGLREMADFLHKPLPHLDVLGPEVWMDESLATCLLAVLPHLLRNSMDHGIEAPQERLESGKAAEGTIRLEFEVFEEQLQIRFGDDGQGLNLRRIHQKVLEKGLMEADSTPTAQQLAEFIFQSSFSTSAAVSEISGRGVGMDAVRHEIQMLGGDIAVQLEHPLATDLKAQAAIFIIRLPYKELNQVRGLSA